MKALKTFQELRGKPTNVMNKVKEHFGNNYTLSNLDRLFSFISPIAERFDIINLYALTAINNRLPKQLKTNTINNNILNETDIINEIRPIKRFLEILIKIPEFNVNLIFNKLNRLVKEPLARKMSLKIAKKYTKKSVARIIKIAAGVKQ